MDIDSKILNKQKILAKLLELNEDVAPEKMEQAINTSFDEMAVALVCYDRVELRGFGSLIVRRRDSGEARNPKSGVRVQVSDRGALYFRASKQLVKRLNTAPLNDNFANQ